MKKKPIHMLKEWQTRALFRFFKNNPPKLLEKKENAK